MIRSRKATISGFAGGFAAALAVGIAAGMYAYSSEDASEPQLAAIPSVAVTKKQSASNEPNLPAEPTTEELREFRAMLQEFEPYETTYDDFRPAETEATAYAEPVETRQQTTFLQQTVQRKQALTQKVNPLVKSIRALENEIDRTHTMYYPILTNLQYAGNDGGYAQLFDEYDKAIRELEQRLGLLYDQLYGIYPTAVLTQADGTRSLDAAVVDTFVGGV